MHSNSTKATRRLRLNHSFTIRTSAFALAMLPFLPLHAISAKNESITQYTEVTQQKKLTVVAVKNPTTVFSNGQNLHGFGYDLMRNYAKSLNVDLDFKVVNDNTTALNLVSQGKANLAMTNASMEKIESKKLNFFSATCGNFNALNQNGLDTNINLVTRNAEDPLAQTASGFVCDAKTDGSMDHLAAFYTRNAVDDNGWDIVEQDLKQRMPIYKASFKQVAQKYNLDWHMLVAMGYQESYLKPNSVSPTGVRGLMMLTNSTAKAMGIQNRDDPKQSIQGGAKYYDQLLEQYNEIPFPDRNWYALVAYNMGPGALSSIQKQVAKKGKNPNDWINIYAHLQHNQTKNSKYKQALQYVTRIRAYLEHIQTNHTNTINV